MKPKYLKIFKGRNAVELLFDNYQNLQKWLVLNNLDEWDGFSFLNENSQRTTLSTFFGTHFYTARKSFERIVIDEKPCDILRKTLVFSSEETAKLIVKPKRNMVI